MKTRGLLVAALMAAGASARAGVEEIAIPTEENGQTPMLAVPAYRAEVPLEGFRAVPVEGTSIWLPRPSLFEYKNPALIPTLARAVHRTLAGQPRILRTERHSFVITHIVSLNGRLLGVPDDAALDEDGLFPIREIQVRRHLFEDLQTAASNANTPHLPHLYDGIGKWLGTEMDAIAAESASWLREEPQEILEEAAALEAQLTPLLKRAYRREGIEMPERTDAIARAPHSSSQMDKQALRRYLNLFFHAYHLNISEMRRLSDDQRLIAADEAARLYMRMKSYELSLSSLQRNAAAPLETRKAVLAAVGRITREDMARSPQ